MSKNKKSTVSMGTAIAVIASVIICIPLIIGGGIFMMLRLTETANTSTSPPVPASAPAQGANPTLAPPPDGGQWNINEVAAALIGTWDLVDAARSDVLPHRMTFRNEIVQSDIGSGITRVGTKFVNRAGSTVEYDFVWSVPVAVYQRDDAPVIAWSEAAAGHITMDEPMGVAGYFRIWWTDASGDGSGTRDRSFAINEITGQTLYTQTPQGRFLSPLWWDAYARNDNFANFVRGNETDPVTAPDTWTPEEISALLIGIWDLTETDRPDHFADRLYFSDERGGPGAMFRTGTRYIFAPGGTTTEDFTWTAATIDGSGRVATVPLTGRNERAYTVMELTDTIMRLGVPHGGTGTATFVRSGQAVAGIPNTAQGSDSALELFVAELSTNFPGHQLTLYDTIGNGQKDLIIRTARGSRHPQFYLYMRDGNTFQDMGHIGIGFDRWDWSSIQVVEIARHTNTGELIAIFSEGAGDYGIMGTLDSILEARANPALDVFLFPEYVPYMEDNRPFIQSFPSEIR